MQLTPQQLDRARGALVCAGVGDALGVPYEGRPPLPAPNVPLMRGGGLGNYKPGEWSDDTQMLTVIGAVALRTPRLTEPKALSNIARGFLYWSRDGATDMGVQTSAVLSRARVLLARDSALTPREALLSASEHLHMETGMTAGNGSLMRTAPVALCYLTDPEGCAQAARAVSALTHFDPLAGDACAIWCELIRRAVMGEELTPHLAARQVLSSEDYGQWDPWLEEAMRGEPTQFSNNGYVVSALQAALSAVMPLLQKFWEGRPATPQTVRAALYRRCHRGRARRRHRGHGSYSGGMACQVSRLVLLRWPGTLRQAQFRLHGFTRSGPHGRAHRRDVIVTSYDLVTADGIGVGYVDAYSDEEAMTLAEQRGWTPLEVILPPEDSSGGQYSGIRVLRVA
jgi:ADP-ribosylglycohydrolase